MVWNMSKAARAVAGAMLSATLVLGGMAPSVAFGDDPGPREGTGTLAIKCAVGNNVTMYKAIKIFSADVEQENGNGPSTARDFEWASDGIKTTVNAAIRKYANDHDEVPEYNGTTAREAADFMARYIQGTDNETIVAPTDFVNTLANYVGGAVFDKDHKLPDGTVVTGVESIDIQPSAAGSSSPIANPLTEGYYLIIDDATTMTATSASTSPILLLLAEGQNVVMNEKVTIPRIDKTVEEDSEKNTTTHYADAQIGQEVPFKLSGTVSGNIANFSEYYYKFTDTLPEGLDLKKSDESTATATTIGKGDVTVTIDNTKSEINTPAIYTISDGFEVKYEDVKDGNQKLTGEHNLIVEFGNLLSNDVKATGADSVPIDSKSVITVEYTASLNAKAVVGATGNTNKAYIEYNTIPNRVDRGKTTESEATVYEYALKLIKLDKDHELDNNESTETKLKDVEFVIKAKTTDETTNSGKYLKTDGSFGESVLPNKTTAAIDYNSYIFKTDDNGEFVAKGLDGGTYTITEVTPQESYRTLASDLELTIKVNKDKTTKKVQSVTATLTGGEDDGEDTTSPTDNILDKGTRVTVDSNGLITVYATNSKEERLPLTGLPGITMVYIVGGTILVTSLAVIVRRHLREKA